MRRILLEDQKPEPVVILKHRQRFCTYCNKWYRCKDDAAAKAHLETTAHKRNWKKAVYGG